MSILIFAALALPTILVYANALDGEFVWLDRVEIVDGGYRLTAHGDLSKLLTRSLTDYVHRGYRSADSEGGYWRPLYALNLTLDHALFVECTWWYHAENILWHIVVVWLLYLLGRRWSEPDAGRWGPAFWAALVFAVHPLGVTSVVWISGRKDVLCAVFGIAALLCHANLLRIDRTQNCGEWRDWLSVVLSALFTATALGFKELAAVVPFVATCYSVLYWHRGRRRESFLGLAGAGLMIAVVIAVFAYRYVVLGGLGLNSPELPVNGVGKAATFLSLQSQYWSLIALPSEPVLSDAWRLRDSFSISLLLTVLAATGVVVGCITKYRRHSATKGVLWFLIWMLPASGIVALFHVRAERYLYPASWGLIFAAWSIAFSWSGRQRFRIVSISAAAAFAIWAGVATVLSNRYWKNDSILFNRAVTLDPDYVEGHIALGNIDLEKGDYESAAAAFKKALDLRNDKTLAAYCPDFVLETNLGLAEYYQGRLSESARLFEAAANRRPDDFRARYHMGLVAQARGNFAEARREYLESLRLRPGEFQASSNLAAIELAQRKYGRSISLLKPLLEQRPDDVANWINFAQALMSNGDYADAAKAWTSAISLSPRDADLRARLALCLHHTGQFETARKALSKAEAIDASHPSVRTARRQIIPAVWE